MLSAPLIRSLNLAGVVRAYDLQKYDHTLVMLLEDFGGDSLERLVQDRQVAIMDFLTLAVQITKIVGALHRRNIIHKDLCPANILWNPTTGQLKIIDFGLATMLSRENPVLTNPDGLEGTLAYISPEQTGRMNRSIDYRTDFYTLGITFYELLTRQLPFESDDQPELLDLNSIVVRLSTLLHRLIGEDIELVTLPGAELGFVQADPTQIEQVVLNLALNARDAMPEGGNLTIETAIADLGGRRHRSARRHQSGPLCAAGNQG